MIPFECDLCVFRKLRYRSSDRTSPSDKLLEACIRRMTLDAFWSCAAPTVKGQTYNLKCALAYSATVGLLPGPYVHDGPLPDYDHCGYTVAIQMLLYSRSRGNHSTDYVQFDSIRKFRSAYGNFLRAAPQANRVPISLGDQTGRYHTVILHGPMRLSKYRMGQDRHPNYAMSMDLLHAVIEDAAVLRAQDALSDRERHRWIVFRAYVVILYVVSLCGAEGLLLDLDGLCRHRGEGGDEYLVIALLGKIKGEHQDLAHLLPCVHGVTSSGIKVKQAIDDLIEIKEKHGFRDGPAISDSSGHVHKIRDIVCTKSWMICLTMTSTCSQSMLGIRRSYTRCIKLSEPFGERLTPMPWK
eukprot:scaffold40823_cov60-Attheya_sp.AAC.1